MPLPPPRPFAHMLMVLALGIGLCALFLPALDNLSNYQGDESLWLTVSNKLFRLYAIERQFDHPAWQHEYSTFGSRQPQIGKYIIGLGTSFVNFKDEPDVYTWHWDQSWAWNMEHTIPPRAVVTTGRFPVAVMGIIACLVFYWLVVLVTNPWCALLALGSLLGARLLLISSRRAMIDTPVLAFGLMTLVGIIYVLRILRSERAWRAIRWAAPTGFFAGLAVGTKLNALLILAVCCCALLGEALLAIRTSHRQAYAPLLCLATIVGSAALVFYVSNPFLYYQPLVGIRHLLELNTLIAKIPFAPLHSLSERVIAVWNNMQVYGPLASLGLAYDRWLILLGIIAVGATVRHGPAQPTARQLDLISIWIMLSYVGITLWIPHDWERYYLPLQPCNAFLQAYGIWWLATTGVPYAHTALKVVMIKVRSS